MITIIVDVQGFILSGNSFPREISWVHRTLEIGETISIFNPNYILSDIDKNIAREITEKNHGLELERYPNFSTSPLWLNQEDVKDYFKQLHQLYGGIFGIRGGVINKNLFEEWDIPVEILNVPKCVKILGPNCSMYRALYYKQCLEKNVSLLNE